MRASRKSYVGVGTPLGIQARVRDGGSDEVMDLRFDLLKRKPEEWTDPDRGMEQLALAILADATGSDNYALLRYERFTDDVTGFLPVAEEWRITFDEVTKWVNAHPITEDDL